MAHLFHHKNVWCAKFYPNGRELFKPLKTGDFRIASEGAKYLEAGLDPDEFENENTELAQRAAKPFFATSTFK